MAKSIKVAVLVGSLREAALTRKLAQALIRLAPAPLELETVEIGDLPLYNADREAAVPAEWQRFRAEAGAAAAVLFVTPEYNRSVPGGLKNALDIGSRPYGQSVWRGKPAAIVSQSPGAIGGFGANHHLRQSLVFLDMPVLQQESYLGYSDKLFDERGELIKPDTAAFLGGVLERFARWIEITGNHSRTAAGA